MSNKALMSFITCIENDDATGDTAEMYSRERDRVGYLPNLARTFGARPGVYRAWRELIGEVTSSMPLRRFELVTFVAARELRSTYCSVAHGGILAESFLAPEDVIELAEGGLPDALDDCELAVVAFAARVARRPSDVTAEDVDELRKHGLSEAEILDVVLTVAARCFFSTVLEATGTLADSVFTDRLEPALRSALTVGRPIAQVRAGAPAPAGPPSVSVGSPRGSGLPGADLGDRSPHQG